MTDAEALPATPVVPSLSYEHLVATGDELVVTGPPVGDRRGAKPAGPFGTQLGPFSCLMSPIPWKLALDAIVGPNVGDAIAAEIARERLRWVRGYLTTEGAQLAAAVAELRSTGLIRVFGRDGEIAWERVRREPRPAHSFNQPPEPPRTVPIETTDDATRRLKDAELRGFDARVLALVRAELDARGVA